MLTNQERVKYNEYQRNDMNARHAEGKTRFSSLTGSMNQRDKSHGVLRQNTTTKELRTEFYKRHPDMIFIDEDGTKHLMTLKSGQNQISVDRIHDKLPNGEYAPHTFDNIRFVPLKLNVALKAPPSEIEKHKEKMAGFVCPKTITGRERRLIVYRIKDVKTTSKMPTRQARGIVLDRSFTIDAAIHKLIHDQKLRCAVSGLVMLFETRSPFTISIDRIDNTVGYTYENVQFVCRFKQFADGHASKRKGETLEQTNERVKKLRFIENPTL